LPHVTATYQEPSAFFRACAIGGETRSVLVSITVKSTIVVLSVAVPYHARHRQLAARIVITRQIVVLNRHVVAVGRRSSCRALRALPAWRGGDAVTAARCTAFLRPRCLPLPRAACCLPSSWVLSAIVVVGRAMHEGLRCLSRSPDRCERAAPVGFRHLAFWQS